VTIPEAATLLGITQNAVRQRIRRGNIEYEKDDTGRTYVFLDSDVTRSDTTGDTSRDGLLYRSLQDQIDTLKRELSIRNEELRRKDHLLAALTERIPAIEPPPSSDAENTPSEATESVLRDSKDTDRGDTPQEVQTRPWWRRIFE